MKRTVMCIVAFAVVLCIIIPVNIVTPNAASVFYSSATTLAIKNHIEYDAGFNRYCTVQGSCTDGKYAYFAANNGSTTVLKYNVNTWELVKKKSGIDLGHANDMTYNPNDNVIVVANNAPDYNIITFLDPDSLDIIGTKKIKQKIYSISYNSLHDCYVIGISGTYDFAMLDKSFKLIKKYKGYNSGYLRQGSDCDDKYLYFVQSGGGGNLIVIYDWDGALVDTVTVDKSLEIENIFHVQNTIYITLHYYGNFVYRIGISDPTAIKYKVYYDPGDGSGAMDDTTVIYGKSTKLSKCTFTRDGYFFGGWKFKQNATNTWYGKKSSTSGNEWLKKDSIDEYTLYKDEAKISKTTKVGNVTAEAFWIADEYMIYYNANTGDGFIPARSVGYYDNFTLDKNTLSKMGFVFGGWTATRDIDNKHYGYAKGVDKPAWLSSGEMEKEYIFSDCQTVSQMTYDKGVTFSALWRSAFLFSKDGSTLESYIGTDEDVYFPGDAANANAIGDNAFENCTDMKTLTIPQSINSVGDNVLSGCTNLKKIYFVSNVPQSTTDTSFDTDTNPECYMVTNGDVVFIGWCIDKNSVSLMQAVSRKFFQ